MPLLGAGLPSLARLAEQRRQPEEE